MIQFIYILLATIVIIFVSLIGVIFAWKKLEHWVEKNLHHLVSFSAGVFLKSLSVPFKVQVPSSSKAVT